MMPSLYKFCAKTATGMFQNTINTLKTALPSNTNAQQVADDWTYIANDVSVNIRKKEEKKLFDFDDFFFFCRIMIQFCV